MNMGISFVMQEFNLIPDLTVYENIYLGHKEMYRYRTVLNKKAAIQKTRDVLKLFNMENHIDPLARVAELSVAEQQIIEILKAVSLNSRIIILDEPTAALTNTEAKRLFEIIQNLKGQGVAFIVVSHRFNEIFQISDRITVLRDGCLVVEGQDMKTMNENKLIQAMVGRDIKDLFGEKKSRWKGGTAEPILKVEDLYDSYDFLKGISFDAYRGEILGIAGLVGAGRTTLARTIFGADPRKGGKVFVDGVEIAKNSPRSAIKNGLSFVTENRKEEGLFLELPILMNTVFVKSSISSGFTLKHKLEESECSDSMTKLNVKLGQQLDPAKSLSGGNQQKVVLAKWLLTSPKVIILDEPTRGIDISAKAEIYSIIHKFVAEGMAVIIISSELPEIIGICDRVIVMRDSEIVADMPAREASEESIMYQASFGTSIDRKEKEEI